jgi:CheY-like chemotaxis protein
MNAIIGMTELALDTPLTEDQRQCLTTVKSAADSLLAILNDLLDFAKIEAGKLDLDLADFSLRAAVGDTMRALAVRAHKKGLELVCHVQADVPDVLVGDAGRLRQVLLNLIGNAIKFTDEGEVVVRVELANGGVVSGEWSDTTTHHSPLTTHLRFMVRDTGVGIPRDKQQQIFRAFEQEDTSTTRRYGGTGLGLSIASRLVALMGGAITVDSEPGRGSTFAFTARFGVQPHPPAPTADHPLNSPAPARLRGLRVLVVDDNATNRRILEDWLHGWRMEPAAVGDGLAALDALWDAVSAGRPYPLVLLDARMPDADGFAIAARIRKRAELAATRIVLLTSGDRPGDWARSRAQRVDAHLLKPVQQEELLETIYRVMSRAGGRPASGYPATAAGPAAEREPSRPPTLAAPLRVLVAEDNEFNVRHLEQLLSRRGHEVHVANTGRDALELLGIGDCGLRTEDGQSAIAYPQSAIQFDLLLLDLHMPELDGFQVVRAIRDRERASGGHLPVIALTARARKEDREQCLAAGMDDYLAKPLRAAELFAAIECVVPTRASAGPTPAAGLLDPVILLAACGDDAEALRGRCEDLRTYLPSRLAAAGDALKAGDAPRLREAAHKLCGLLSVFSTAAAAVASDLEDRAADSRLDESSPLVNRLQAMSADLLRQADGLSIDILRQQSEAIGRG